MKTKRLCTICARSGSKGVKEKNIRILSGKPLIAYSILQAQATGLFDEIVVSSDSEKILSIANEWGVKHLIQRPDELASDEVGKIPVIIHSVLEMEKRTLKQYDLIIDLDVTSPLRDISDIVGAVQLLETKQVTNVITGTRARRSPYFNLVEENGEGFVQLSKPLKQAVLRRQDSPKCYDMNASVYVWKRNALIQNMAVFNKDTMLYEMPEERSIDIDTELDFEIVEFLMKRKGENS